MDLQRVGTLDIRDVNGNLMITDVASARVRNRGGNLRIVDVTAIVGGKVDIRDTSGQIHTEDTGPLSIRDTSGDITVRRAASLDVISKESCRIAAGGIGGPVEVPPGFKVNQIQ